MTAHHLAAEQITALWRAAFGTTPPIGHRCRAAHATRWLRIHSLPQSKRYPSAGAQGDAERREICRRHHAAATAVLGAAADCILFAARYSHRADGADLTEPARAPHAPHAPAALTASGLHFAQLPALAFRGEGDDTVAHFFSAQTTWHPGAHDALILAVAEEATAGLLWANLQRGTAYAPYDGGADLFFASPSDVPAATRRFHDWLSARQDGL